MCILVIKERTKESSGWCYKFRNRADDEDGSGITRRASEGNPQRSQSWPSCRLCAGESSCSSRMESLPRTCLSNSSTASPICFLESR